MEKTFQLGERVAVYEEGERVICTIQEIYGDNPNQVKVNAGDNHSWKYRVVHVNQVRKFKKDPSKEIWIREADTLIYDKEFLAGNPVNKEVATHYARRGSHWTKYIRAKDSE